MKLIGLSWLLMLSAIFLMRGIAYADSPAFYHYDRGVRLASEGKLAEAKASFGRSLKADPQNYPTQRCLPILEDVEKQRIKRQTGVHLFRGIFFFNVYKDDEALQELNQAAELDPGYALIYSTRADVYIDKKRFDDALADYEKALKLNPQSGMVYLNRAKVLQQKERLLCFIAGINPVHCLPDPFRILTLQT